MPSSTSRPSTSKPRGICLYYNHPRGCYAADKCKFLHGEPPKEAKPDDPPMLTPYDKAKRCHFYAQGFCRRGDTCWFLHVSDRTDTSATLSEDDEEFCSICFEKPVTFGLLGGCSHIFCSTCIKQWRDPKDKPGGVLESGNTKKCPMCRVSSSFITPSSKFFKAGTKEKDEIIKAYKKSMSRVPCLCFQHSLQKDKDKPFCPYGKDCFYQHIKADGTPHIFKEGVDVTMRKFRRRGGPVMDGLNIMSFSLELADFLLPIDPSTRIAIRERPNIASHSNAADTRPTHPRQRHREREQHRMNGFSARRLQQVRESSERLNDVISEGASLDSLNTAIEALRAGLGRSDVNSGDSGRRPDRVTREQADVSNDGTADTQEDEVIERLEGLADQMLASIQILRMNAQEEETGRDGAETPLPALESLEQNGQSSGENNNDMPSQQLRPYGWSDNADDGYESANSMPTLRSVSDSSDNQTASSDADSDENEMPSRRIVELGDQAVLTAAQTAERIQTIERSQGHIYSQPVSSSEEGEGEERDESALSEGEEPELRSEPPFVTDGRGRVVWTSPGEENKSMEEQSGESASRPEAAGSGGLLGWFNALF